MKKVVTTGFILIFLGGILVGSSLGGPFPGRAERIKEIKERLITLRNWKLMEEFNLTGQRAQRVFDILSMFDKERERLILKRRGLIRRLEESLRGQASDAELKGIMKELTDVNVEISKIPKRELEGLKEVFNTKELARYLLFTQRFAREARRLIGRPRPNFPKGQGQRPPRVDRGPQNIY